METAGCVSEARCKYMITHDFPTRRRAFSLIELIVVIAVLVSLLALVVPAVSGFGRSSALTRGGNLVTNLASLARQEAMTRNTMTALVLLRDQGSDADYRAFTVATYEPGLGWRQTTAWETLPTGVVVDRNIESSTDSELGSFVRKSPQSTSPGRWSSTSA